MLLSTGTQYRRDTMEETFDLGDKKVDVVQIMKEIRESIQRKRMQGIYTDEEIEDLSVVKLRSFADESGVDPELLERMLAPNHNWNFSTDYTIRSHRKGAPARLIILVKRMIRPVVRLYTDHILNRQAQLNLYFAHLLHNSIREITRLQIELISTRSRLDVIEREKDLMVKQQKSLEGMDQFRSEDQGEKET